MADLRSELRRRLSGLDGLEDRPQLGGWGLYLDGEMFALIQGGRVYFKTHPETLVNFRQWGAVPFQPNPRLQFGEYYELPAEVLAEDDQLLRWTREASARVT